MQTYDTVDPNKRTLMNYILYVNPYDCTLMNATPYESVDSNELLMMWCRRAVV